MPKTGPDRPLTAKQSAFVAAYMISRNGADAVRQAGYTTDRPDRLAYQMLRSDRVVREITRRQTALVKRTEIDEEWVLQRLAQTYGLACERHQYSAATKALELVGKSIGMFDSTRSLNPQTGYEITVRKVEVDEVVDEV
jgi:phage terminase small subunit